MKTLIIYISINHKNTEKVAKVMADVLKADLVDLCKTKPETIESYDLIGFGSGIYMWRHHKILFDLIDRLPFSKNKKAFIFSTAGAPTFLSFLLHSPLRRKLITKGFEIVDELCLPGFDTYGVLKLFGGLNKGRPNKSDLQKAEKFAEKLLK